MKVLLLGSENEHCEALRSRIEAFGDVVDFLADRITPEGAFMLAPDIIVSYNYHFILPESVLAVPPRGAINLHISYLPWNKGTDPNFWSIVEDTPKGTSVHYMDKGLDTGDIIAQEKIAFGSEDTLRTSYEKLHALIRELFFNNWQDIKCGSARRIKQSGEGTHHKRSDREAFLYLVAERGWDTPLADLTTLKLDHAVIHGS